ncbi:hypothetical protein PRZ48_000889 [Zasmidium cellare]|uniref:Calcineurin-like phosphoesterase domain-containing protein n=1 Tax=Zasmidium cellare TaxID=395010 RepID=A0ABR0F0D6_ZASCE|nr:hypothetical protein PRZ48_000889 [Zasmidium cellare]
MATVKTRVLIISDTHCAPLAEQDEGRQPFAPFKAPLPKADVLIHCGDLTMTGLEKEYHKTLDMLAQIDAPVKLVIPGNHDLSLDRDFVFSHAERDSKSEAEAQAKVDKARELWTSADGRAQKEGITYLTEGVHQIDLPNGASVTIYASPYTPEFYDWGFPYERDEDRFNSPLRTLSDAKNIAPYPVPPFTHTIVPVDILLTHGPPYARLDQTSRGDYAGCPHLLRALMRSRPLIHCFGHIHEGWGAERIKWSDKADEVADSTATISQWQNGSWKEGVAGQGSAIETIKTNLDAAKERHAVLVDVSKEGGQPLKKGEESLLVNAAIMDVEYSPVNAPWIVDIDLPKA